MPLTVVVGTQRGDEAKAVVAGREVLREDEGRHLAVVRFNGTGNAGHSMFIDGVKVVLHQTPCGIIRKGVMSYMGGGVLLEPVGQFKESRDLAAKGYPLSRQNLMIDELAHMVLPHHIALDKMREVSKGRQGSTANGVSFCAADKYERIGSRVFEMANEKTITERVQAGYDRHPSLRDTQLRETLKLPSIEEELEIYIQAMKNLRGLVGDTKAGVQSYIKNGDWVLAEGAQSFQLDPDLGTYPSSTSTSGTVAGAMSGAGVGFSDVKRVIGVVKATPSSVGAPQSMLPALVKDKALAARLRGVEGSVDGEFGNSTGRERDLLFPDFPMLRASVASQKYTELVITKCDKLREYGDEIPVVDSYAYHPQFGPHEVLSIAPVRIDMLENCVPAFIRIPDNSSLDLSGARTVNELPTSVMKFRDMVSEAMDAPVTSIGVGPGFEQVVRL